MRTALLLLLTCFATTATAHDGHKGAQPSVDLLRSSILCELTYVDKYMKMALPLINADPVPDQAARDAHSKAWEKRKAAQELLAVNETALAYQRSAEARKELKKLLKPLWEWNTTEAQLADLVGEQIACARIRLSVTQPHLQSHPLLGASKGYNLAKERIDGAELGRKQGQTRMAFFKVEDGLHQLDIAIGWEWPGVVAVDK